METNENEICWMDFIEKDEPEKIIRKYEGKLTSKFNKYQRAYDSGYKVMWYNEFLDKWYSINNLTECHLTDDKKKKRIVY